MLLKLELYEEIGGGLLGHGVTHNYRELRPCCAIEFPSETSPRTPGYNPSSHHDLKTPE
jgi:hypothetical protein